MYIPVTLETKIVFTVTRPVGTFLDPAKLFSMIDGGVISPRPAQLASTHTQPCITLSLLFVRGIGGLCAADLPALRPLSPRFSSYYKCIIDSLLAHLARVCKFLPF